jgi:hypothetical protein
MKHQQKILTDLHQRLYQILPEYKAISSWMGESGTFKAVDAEGNVFIVEFSRSEVGLRQEKRFFCDYQSLVVNSHTRNEAKRPEAGDNWNLTLLG